jgi:ferrous iron transport protein A
MRIVFNDSTTADAHAQQVTVPLHQLRKGDCATVVGMTEGGSEDDAATRRRLLELGFAQGEAIRIVAEAFPRRDPIAVRLGNVTFALRRHEAAMIRVLPAGRAAA